MQKRTKTNKSFWFLSIPHKNIKWWGSFIFGFFLLFCFCGFKVTNHATDWKKMDWKKIETWWDSNSIGKTKKMDWKKKSNPLPFPFNPFPFIPTYSSLILSTIFFELKHFNSWRIWHWKIQIRKNKIKIVEKTKNKNDSVVSFFFARKRKKKKTLQKSFFPARKSFITPLHKIFF